MDRSNSKFMNITSPYSRFYKPRLRADQNELLTKRLGASKLTRKELENKYYDLCEENVIVKRENNENKEKIKHLTTKLLRLTSTSGRSIKPRELFSTDDTLKVRLIDLENKNSMLKDQLKAVVTKYGKKLKDMPMYSPISFEDSNRDEKMDTKREEKSGCSLSRKSPLTVTNSSEDLSSKRDSPYSNAKGNVTNKSAYNPTPLDEQTRHKQANEIDKLQDEINALNSYLEETRQTNIELLKEISDLRMKWSEIDLSKKLAEDIKVIELNRCLEEAKVEMQRLKQYSDDLVKDTCAKLEIERQTTTELEEKLKVESDKSLENQMKLERAENERKQLDELEKVLKQKNLEIETLRDQSNRFQTIANSNEGDDIKLHELIELNDELKKQVENEASASSSLEFSHNSLLQKVKTLSSHNDELIVELEGRKNEVCFLKQKNCEIEMELKKLKKIKLDLENVNKTLCQKISEYRKKSDISRLTIEEAEAWSNTFPQISENPSPLVKIDSGDTYIPVDCDNEIPVIKINSETKASFYSRPDYQQFSYKRNYRFENLVQTMHYKNRLELFEPSSKMQLERAQNTKRALKYYRYYHNMINSTKVPMACIDDYTNTENFSDLSSIRNDICSDETIEEISPDSPPDDIELSMSEQQSTISMSCHQNGNDSGNTINFKINSLIFADNNSYSNVEIEFINKIDRKSKRFSLDSTKMQQKIYLEDKNKMNFLLIFSELNRNEFGFSIFQNEIEENRGGKMDLELDVYDICFPHKILGKLFINIFI